MVWTINGNAATAVAAYTRYKANVQYPHPFPAAGQWARWYEDAVGYFFDVNSPGAQSFETTYCGVTKPAGTPYYFIYIRSSVVFTECGQTFGGTAFPSFNMFEPTVLSAWSKFRGAGGACPSCPPTQEESNMWVQQQIDGGHWADVVKPALDTVVRAAVTWQDLENVGITRKPKIIAVDAGHGSCPGDDSGTTGPQGTKEADIVLDIARRLAADLRTRGYEARETRLDECDVLLQTRVDIANLTPKAEVFVSIHLNGSKTRSANGTEVWIDPDAGFKILAESLATRIVQAQAQSLSLTLRTSTYSGILGVKWSGYDAPWKNKKIFVLQFAAMPAALSEVAFLTNPDQEQLFLDPAYRQRAAAAIGGAVTQFFGP